jgi:hypothetical protein
MRLFKPVYILNNISYGLQTRCIQYADAKTLKIRCKISYCFKKKKMKDMFKYNHNNGLKYLDRWFKLLC